MTEEEEGIEIPKKMPTPPFKEGEEKTIPVPPAPKKAPEALSLPPAVPPTPLPPMTPIPPTTPFTAPPRAPAKTAAVPDSKKLPLFIKIEKYNDVIQNIDLMKSYILSLRDVVDALDGIEKELAKGLSVMHKTVDRFNSITSLLESRVARPTEKETKPVEMKPGAESPKEIEKYVKDMHDNLKKIHAELSAVSE